ncbi:hypothetical protein BDZ91DRAFT_714120 [Kalaharituber pfeilii]|nr:hypothetical protein BDZ91DRAFT_714120 [Kalaharituber pfeilii]
MPSMARRSQPLGPDMPFKPAHCSQSPPPDIPSGPNIPSKPVHHRSQHLLSQSQIQLLKYWQLCGWPVERTKKMHAHTKCAYATQAICEPTLCLFGLAGGNSLRLPPPLQTQGWKKLSSGRVLDRNYLID